MVVIDGQHNTEHDLGLPRRWNSPPAVRPRVTRSLPLDPEDGSTAGPPTDRLGLDRRGFRCPRRWLQLVCEVWVCGPVESRGERCRLDTFRNESTGTGAWTHHLRLPSGKNRGGPGGAGASVLHGADQGQGVMSLSIVRTVVSTHDSSSATPVVAESKKTFQEKEPLKLTANGPEAESAVDAVASA